jgi:hypothetical protein
MDRAVRDGAKETGMSIKEYIMDGPDPMSVAVLVEDSIAVRSRPSCVSVHDEDSGAGVIQ